MKQFLKKIFQEIVKKIILGTSDAWSMSPLSRRPSKPAYYIEDWQISGIFEFKVRPPSYQSYLWLRPCIALSPYLEQRCWEALSRLEPIIHSMYASTLLCKVTRNMIRLSNFQPNCHCDKRPPVKRCWGVFLFTWEPMKTERWAEWIKNFEIFKTLWNW